MTERSFKRFRIACFAVLAVGYVVGYFLFLF